MKGLQLVHAGTERHDELDERSNQVRSPYLSAREAIVYLRLGSKRALYRLITEHGLPVCRRGRQYLFDTRDLDAWIHGFGSALEMARANSRKRA